MNVTSMLNGSSPAVSRQQESDSRGRSRTPWDAGGYSLPLHPHPQSQSQQSQQPQQPSGFTTTVNTVNPSDSTNENSTSYIKHGLSDSHSSLSSFASSTSTTHSRFSSASTISGFHYFGALSTDDPFKDVQHKSELGEASLSPFSPPLPSVFPRATGPPTPSFDPLAAIAENRLSQIRLVDQPTYQARLVDMSSPYPDRPSEMFVPQDRPVDLAERLPSTRLPAANTFDEPNEDHQKSASITPSRTSSPTDAILIKRTALPNARIYTEPSDSVVMESFVREQNYSAYMDEDMDRANAGRLTLDTRVHKRTISAPDMQVPRAIFSQNGSGRPTGLGPIAEPTPPPSQHPDNYSPREIGGYTDQATSPETTPPQQEQKPPCMFMENCNLDSPIRKAISHIFGRNKMCTRLIPADVWVYFCRKHYQRARYRDQVEYARNTQCKLILEQIERIAAWSDGNRERGEGGVVKDWGLALRKREQKRVDDLEEVEESRNDEDSIDTSRMSAPATAVPTWLRDLCGKNYSTVEILEIFNRLHQELINADVPVFPDIEILPNIIVDRETPKSPKGYARRKPVPAAHQRSQSLGATLNNNRIPLTRKMSNDLSPASTAGYSDDSEIRASKRKRVEQREEDLHPFQYPMQLMHPVHEHARHSSMVPTISENRTYEEHFDQPALASEHGSGPSIPQLRAPAPRRHITRSTAAQLDSGVVNYERAYSHARPSMHRRSLSDMSIVQQEQTHFRAAPASTMYSLSHAQAQAGSHRYISAPGVTTVVNSLGQRATPSHIRHQSTPVVTDGFVPSAVAPDSGLPSLPGRYVHETPETKLVYTSRR